MKEKESIPFLLDNIRYLCRMRKITVHKLAYDLEIPVSTISKWNFTTPSVLYALKVAKYLDVQLETLCDASLEMKEYDLFIESLITKTQSNEVCWNLNTDDAITNSVKWHEKVTANVENFYSQPWDEFKDEAYGSFGGIYILKKNDDSSVVFAHQQEPYTPDDEERFHDFYHLFLYYDKRLHYIDGSKKETLLKAIQKQVHTDVEEKRNKEFIESFFD